MAFIYLALVPRMGNSASRLHEGALTPPSSPTGLFQYAVKLCEHTGCTAANLCLVNFHKGGDSVPRGKLELGSFFVAAYSVQTKDQAKVNATLRWLEERVWMDGPSLGIHLAACEAYPKNGGAEEGMAPLWWLPPQSVAAVGPERMLASV